MPLAPDNEEVVTHSKRNVDPLRPENQIWVAYNALPGGNVVIQHFEDIYFYQKVGDGQKEIYITAKESMEAFKKSPQVALYCYDPITKEYKLSKNQVLVYDGQDSAMLYRKKRAANIVLDWAYKKGIAPIMASKDQKGQDPKTYEYNKRIEALEKRIDEQDTKLDKILAAVGQK